MNDSLLFSALIVALGLRELLGFSLWFLMAMAALAASLALFEERASSHVLVIQDPVKEKTRKAVVL